MPRRLESLPFLGQGILPGPDPSPFRSFFHDTHTATLARALMTPHSRPLGRVTLAWVTAIFSAAVVVGWIVAVASSSNPLDFVWSDWGQFHMAGRRLLDGAWDQVYPGELTGLQNPNFPDRLYFLYPPFALPVTAPFGAVKPFVAYLLAVATVLGTTLLGLYLAGRAYSASRLDHVVVTTCVVSSAAWLSALLLGHLSSLVFVVAAVGFWCWKRGWTLRAGLVLAFLIAKPNLGLPFAALLTLAGPRRCVIGFAVGSVFILASSLVFPIELWPDWWLTMDRYSTVIAEETPPWKQLTLFASIQWLSGTVGSDWLLLGLYATGAILLSGWLLWVWRRARPAEGFVIDRLYGATWLAILTLNPYAYFYDGLLLVFPATSWWLHREHYGSRGAWLGISGILVFVFVWEHVVLWAGTPLWEAVHRGPSPVGLLLTIWLALELWDLGTLKRPEQAAKELR